MSRFDVLKMDRIFNMLTLRMIYEIVPNYKDSSEIYHSKDNVDFSKVKKKKKLH